MTAPEFRPGDLARSTIQQIDLPVTAVDGDRIRLSWPGEGGWANGRWYAASGFRHVTPTAEHADGNHWARITEGPHAGARGVLTRVHDGGSTGGFCKCGGVSVRPAGLGDDLHTTVAPHAVLVAPPADPAPVTPEWSVGNEAVVEVAEYERYGMGPGECGVLEPGDTVTLVEPHHNAANWMCRAPDGSEGHLVAVKHLRPVAPEPAEQDQPERLTWRQAEMAGGMLSPTLAWVEKPTGEIVGHVTFSGVDAARAVADRDEAAGLRALVTQVEGARDYAAVSARDLGAKAAGLRAEVERLREENGYLRREKDASVEKGLEWRAELDALAAAPGAGHDLPKVEVRIDGDTMSAGAYIDGERWAFVSLWPDLASAIDRVAKVTAAEHALLDHLLAEREREAAQAQAPAYPGTSDAASAWDEGFEAGTEHTVALSAPPGPCGPVDPPSNPYVGAQAQAPAGDGDRG